MKITSTFPALTYFVVAGVLIANILIIQTTRTNQKLNTLQNKYLQCLAEQFIRAQTEIITTTDLEKCIITADPLPSPDPVAPPVAPPNQVQQPNSQPAPPQNPSSQNPPPQNPPPPPPDQGLIPDDIPVLGGL